MPPVPATTVRVVDRIRGRHEGPHRDGEIADLNRLAEVGSEMLHAAIAHVKTQRKIRSKK